MFDIIIYYLKIIILSLCGIKDMFYLCFNKFNDRFLVRKKKKGQIGLNHVSQVIFGHLVDTLQENKKYNKIIKKYKKHKYELPKYSKLSNCSLKSIEIENAGGKSNVSEMYSIDLFLKKYNAKNFIFEKQVKYWVDYKMVDFICTINNERVGISVTRAMGYPNISDFNKDKALLLLNKKINGLVIARNSVIESQNFSRCILHIWCQTNKIAKMIVKCYKNANNLQVDSDLLLLITVCLDEGIYKNYINEN